MNKATNPMPRSDAENMAVENDVVVNDEQVTFHFDDRQYRVRGLEKNNSSQQLKLNVLARRDELFHSDTFDLYRARSRNSFIKAAATELYVDDQLVKLDVGKMLLKLEQLQLDRIEQATATSQPVELSEAEKVAAIEYLNKPNLVDRILADFDTCGLVGEQTNKLIGYLGCVSRRLAKPLALLIQSGSAAGKTTLMDAVLAFMPDEEKVRYSAMTGQSLYYMGSDSMKHKILAIAEEEGVTQASYALKLLQSDGKLTIAAAGKNSGTGRQLTETYSVEGPVMMFLTTTSERPDPELQNRCITLRVNESSKQTASIQASQRSGYLPLSNHQQQETIKTLHQNAQRLLEPLTVIMPWANQLTFRHDQTRMRRDNAKYLSLIATIALLHQHQREVIELENDIRAVEATKSDVELANLLISEVMGHSLDSLLPQTRQLLVLIDNLVTERTALEKQDRRAIRFMQRELRESFGWSDFQVRHHLKRLVELEYVLPHRTGYGNGKQYELLYDGQGRDGKPFLLGLTDPAKLK